MKSFKDLSLKHKLVIVRYLNDNSKLRKDKIKKFSLPKGKTCIGAGDCLNWCFAGKGFYRVHAKTIAKAHNRNLEYSKSEDFADKMIVEIVKRKLKIIRIHDSGDFYSQEYLDKWTIIAGSLPHVRFYAYTKSLELDFTEFTRLPNTKIIQSFGSKYDHLIDLRKPHAIVFEHKKNLELMNFIDCSKSDLVALETKNVRIGLIKH